MGFLPDEMKMDLLLDLTGPDFNSVLPAGENADADRCPLECLLDLSCSIWVPAGVRIVATDGLLSWHGWVQPLTAARRRVLATSLKTLLHLVIDGAPGCWTWIEDDAALLGNRWLGFDLDG
ncbi:hypothetical protein ACLOJK_014748 [Asimina triloba]